MKIKMKIRKCFVFLFLILFVLVTALLVIPKSSYAFPSVLGASVIGEEGITLDGYKVKNEEDPINIDTATPTFEGYTTPNAHILLIIRSEPIEKEVLSDAKGYWKYTFKEPIEVGQHTLSMQITNDRGITSKEFLVATFIVPEVKGEQTATPASDEIPLPKSPTINYLTITIGVLGVLALLGIVYAFFLRKPR